MTRHRCRSSSSWIPRSRAAERSGLADAGSRWAVLGGRTRLAGWFRHGELEPLGREAHPVQPPQIAGEQAGDVEFGLDARATQLADRAAAVEDRKIVEA